MFANKLTRQFTSGVVTIAMLCSVITLPFTSTSAVAQALPQPIGLTYVQGPFNTQYPLDNTRIIANIGGVGNGGVTHIAYGERSIYNGNEAAALLGTTNANLSKLLYTFPSNAPALIARFNPIAKELRIFVSKISVAADGTRNVMLSDYTPHHGQRMVAAREYMTVAERADITRGGNNPFAGNRGSAQDPLFYNCDLYCMNLAVGHAMRQYNATIGFIAESKVTYDQKVREWSSGFLGLSKTKEITTKGFVQPRWYVATPVEFQPQGLYSGNSLSLCAVDETPCQPGHIAKSGVSLVEWDASSLSAPIENPYTKVETQSGCAFWCFFLAVFAIVAVIALTGGVALGTALLYGGIAAGVYAVAGGVLNGTSFNDIQFGFFGRTARSLPDFDSNPSEHKDAMNKIVRKYMAEDDIDGSLVGIKNVAQGTPDADGNRCAFASTATNCINTSRGPGSLSRIDSSTRFGGYRAMGVRFDRCKTQNPQADRAAWLTCAAPVRSVDAYNQSAP